MVENVQYYHNMQYQVDPINQTEENGRYLTGSFKNTFLWFLNDPEFFRKNAVHVPYSYSKELSCKKSLKSLAVFEKNCLLTNYYYGSSG